MCVCVCVGRGVCVFPPRSKPGGASLLSWVVIILFFLQAGSYAKSVEYGLMQGVALPEPVCCRIILGFLPLYLMMLILSLDFQDFFFFLLAQVIL